MKQTNGIYLISAQLANLVKLYKNIYSSYLLPKFVFAKKKRFVNVFMSFLPLWMDLHSQNLLEEIYHNKVGQWSLNYTKLENDLLKKFAKKSLKKLSTLPNTLIMQ